MLGLAGVVGVAATGAMVARSERARRAYTPDEVRERLHSRLAESTTAPSSNGSSASTRAAGYRRAHPDAS
ncbi:hypothetical protein [Pseudofrankia sp. EUN1h]|uniref:hypothetical protein n=1 Tax=Pseudofrankia sp. EUN1h TaxID=1834515 RepID=UPI0002D2D435|nr:hypothetical protein [Pseudofrankia sp. EUN1h]